MIRLANNNDLASIMKCIDDARIFIKNTGSTQWNGPLGYPDVKTFTDDIKNETCYVYEEDNNVCAVIVYAGIEEEYNKKEAKWLINTNNYTTIHRIAVREYARGKGIATKLMLHAEKVSIELGRDSIRIDTHPKNIALQNLVKKLGYTCCGSIIYNRIPVEPERLIFEKILKKC